MEIKLSHMPYNIPLSSKLANYKTENIYNTLILNDKFDIYINGDYIKVLYCNKSTNLKTKSVCEVSKNSNDDFDKKIYNDIIS